MIFRLPYYVENGGDGSANVRFYRTLVEAERAEAAEDEGWGEPSANVLTVKIENGKLFFRDYRVVGKKDQLVWVQVE